VNLRQATDYIGGSNTLPCVTFFLFGPVLFFFGSFPLFSADRTDPRPEGLPFCSSFMSELEESGEDSGATLAWME
jgi:hypothetical protein